MGGARTSCQTNLTNLDGKKLENEDEITNAFTHKLKLQFQLTPEENRDFDAGFEQNIKNEWDAYEQNTNTIINTGALGNEGIGRKISQIEVEISIKSFSEKSPGNTGISIIYLKNIPINMIKQLTYLYNCALSIGKFPKIFKQANIVMIPKKNPPTHINDFRPISLLEVPGKVLEKIINKRLRPHLEQIGAFNNFQFGFRPGRSTTGAIALGYEKIARERAKRMKVSMVLRDVKAAFDKVWHLGLTVKLKRLKLPNNITEILIDFLKNRTARVRKTKGNGFGPAIELMAGVPQGAVLSPTLYNIYVADMPQPIYKTSMNITFADDITQIITARTKKQLKISTIKEIENINNFENKWKIRTNTKKFKIIKIAETQTENIEIGGQTITTTKTGRFLGLDIRSSGLNTPLNMRVGMGNSELNKLRIFSELTIKQKKELYMLKVRSKMIYPIIPWLGQPMKNILKMQTVQNKALKYIENKNRDEHIKAQDMHERQQMPAINAVLWKQAQAIWTNLIRTHETEVDTCIKTCYGIYSSYDKKWTSSIRHIIMKHKDLYTQTDGYNLKVNIID